MFLCTEAPLKIGEELRAPMYGKTQGWGLVMKEGVCVPPYAEWIIATLLTATITALPVLLIYCVLNVSKVGYDVLSTFGIAVAFGTLMLGLLKGVS